MSYGRMLEVQARMLAGSRARGHPAVTSGLRLGEETMDTYLSPTTSAIPSGCERSRRSARILA